MASEFDYLRIKWPKLAALATNAARLVDASPSSAIGTMRTFAEWVSDIALEQENIQLSPAASQMDKLEALESSGKIEDDIVSRLHEIRMKGNMAVHEAMGDVDSAHLVLDDLRVISRWLFDREGKHLWGLEKKGDSSEVRVPIGGLYNNNYPGGGGGGSSFRAIGDFLRSKMPIIIISILVIAIVIIVSVSFSRCSTPNEDAEVSPSPTFEAVATATTAPTSTPLPSPTPPIEIDLDSLPIANDFINAYLYKTKWTAGWLDGPFTTEIRTYDSGLGMYIPSNAISKTYASVWASWTLLGDYDTLKFDLGVETTGAYYNPSCGTFSIIIKADTEVVYSSGGDAGSDIKYKDFTFTEEGVEVNIAGCRTLTLELRQGKGTGGTLNIVLGDIRLVPAEGVVVNVTPQEGQDETPVPDAT